MQAYHLPANVDGFQRLAFRRTDGQEFDAQHISDGVLCFTALAMHAIDAPPGAVIFIEEPEQAIHPRRIHDLVELLRGFVHDRRSQFVIATHSRVQLDNFWVCPAQSTPHQPRSDANRSK